MISYDVRKAFDSVQLYTLQATCDRYNLPPSFKAYISACLCGATSSVRTKDGLTQAFNIMSSVRQGDPLAMLLFVLAIDPLHAGWRQNPLYPNARNGYVMGDGTEVFSAGYADDSAAVCSSWTTMKRQHEWCASFFVAHHWDFNVSKTHLVIRSGADKGKQLPPIDPNWIIESGYRRVDGGAAQPTPRGVPIAPQPVTQYATGCRQGTAVPEPKSILSHGPDHEFRYLGLWFRQALRHGL